MTKQELIDDSLVLVRAALTDISGLLADLDSLREDSKYLEDQILLGTDKILILFLHGMLEENADRIADRISRLECAEQLAQRTLAALRKLNCPAVTHFRAELTMETRNSNE